jgi:hypothetical protein
MFTKEQKKKLNILGNLTRDYLYKNEKRVANAIHEAVELLEVQLAAAPNSENELLNEFKKEFGLDFSDAFNKFVIACYNTAQYDRALEVCGMVEKYVLIPIGDKCPFQMSEYYSSGKHSARILAEKLEVYTTATEEGVVPSIMGAEGAEAFSEFQYKFMNGIDSVTGKVRQTVVSAEYKKIEKQVKDGTFLWFGFLKYRTVNEL